MLPPKEPFGYEPTDDPMSTLDRVDYLASIMLDEVISDTQFEELSGLLKSDGDARNRYVENVQLHVDLMQYFGASSDSQSSSIFKTPVLGTLGMDPSQNPEDSGIQVQLPSTDEASS